jgi:NAD(P)-dependent dehydrogenase (short-subunit alcohol dehydrogenase family)
MGSAKAAMESACLYFAVALAKRGITVNAVSPGLTEDSVLNSRPEDAVELARAWHRQWTPMGRLGTPADVGNAVALLCSDEAAWITGQTIRVDGRVAHGHRAAARDAAAAAHVHLENGFITVL